MMTTLTWLRGAAVAAIMVVAPFVLTPPATADPCGPHKELGKYLADHNSERHRGWGLIHDGRLLEIFISEKGTWTVLVSLPTGMSCIVFEGTDWQGKSLTVGPET
jgi:hypothetical protein